MASTGRRPRVLLQIALFVVVAAVIINSSVCLGAVAGSGALDTNRPDFPPPGGVPYPGRKCSTLYKCRGGGPPAGRKAGYNKVGLILRIKGKKKRREKKREHHPRK
ncbi:protein WIR1A-like [Hordeum vulgare subsp. vulgare]|uniref:Predicted protein n=1 Tax=Hordeum vulgare subsp. vulgare TaxID=112509 RepID=F2DN45_HORVV|nr:protein WIR1A-like [Hordeum vulgare subsp. vulgare]BAJ96516.1 predicted protein [Hordeum vulgare subsp. vulgare]